jgi:hypothetical protein
MSTRTGPRTMRLFAALSIISALAGSATLLDPDWIELVFRIDPDRGSGWAEAAFVLVLAAVSIICGLLAVVELIRTSRVRPGRSRPQMAPGVSRSVSSSSPSGGENRSDR